VISRTAVGPASPNLALLITAPALYAWLTAKFTRRYGFSPLAMALGWIVLEWALRSAGFNHSLLSTSESHGPVHRLVADFLGCGFVAFLVAYTNASLLALISKVRLRIPRLMPLAELRDPEIYPVWETFPRFLLLAFHQGNLRAPPFQAVLR
jgi:apolipoprotein N-acyltransferase